MPFCCLAFRALGCFALARVLDASATLEAKNLVQRLSDMGWGKKGPLAFRIEDQRGH